MSPAIPFRRRSSLPSLLIVLGAVAAAVIGFAVTMTFLNWQSRPGAEQTRVEILRPTPTQSGQIEVIDGDTVRFNGVAYRLAATAKEAAARFEGELTALKARPWWKRIAG